ncbi:tryptophan halogenase family protein [Gayadomonas joobiniege]|uniref:tryptophan halogenase family protein n=1 Tax=Gayadomonas joobiniege TaxID=1234606 RepID=UPI00035FE1D2|nr:tryptophan halogenase family protein [Gayadomonas joobiniege]
MKKIIIVGGGTSGWLAAAYLAARLGSKQASGLSISLIESQDILPIGVGEATTPSIRATLADIGFNEFEIMQMTDATFKQGILFKNWFSENQEHAYFNPFERPLRAGSEGLEQYWLKGLDPLKRDFIDAVGIQYRLARLNKAPKTMHDRQYDAPLPYAYHLDAGKLAASLKKAALARGVTHQIAQVVKVELTANKQIHALSLADGRSIQGDFFIDCSGFKASLIKTIDQQDFNDQSHVLFCDSALVCQTPADRKSRKPYTLSTAMPSGWAWQIELMTRTGNGYVYSSKHTSDEQAKRDFCRHLAVPETTELKKLTFPVGYRNRPWLQNCVAIGLAGGFIEPLESTGIHLVEQAVWALAAMLPGYFNQAECADEFNRLMCQHYQHAIHFVKFHYILSQRKQTQFWRDNQNTSSWTDWLLEKHKKWQACPPDIYDLQNLHSIFDHASYQFIYFGMQQSSKPTELSARREAFAQRIFMQTQSAYEKAKKVLPDHWQLLQAIANEPKNKTDYVQQSLQNTRIHASIRNTPQNYKASL